MIVPGSQLSMDPSLLKQDNVPKPSQTNLMMAAAEMHKLGRLSPDDTETDAEAKPPQVKPLHGHSADRRPRGR